MKPSIRQILAGDGDAILMKARLAIRQQRKADMKRWAVFLLVTCHLSLVTSSSFAATRNACTASYSDVNNAVNGVGTMSCGTNYATPASNGDTILVPADSKTWSNTLDVGSKAISLIGAGSGSTIITSSVNGLIRFSNLGSNFARSQRIQIHQHKRPATRRRLFLGAMSERSSG